ncbi:bifunctional 4-hydroxy-2-oxoglutarate aldolase/2-dehydro-3-deoxy-phosphogluconate aldolase [Streptomyces sp. NBC_01361]|uniref:bifunctional 4-hydroxy-2-oxoglutarate aldolase/2-dehydro-3-deoxy-phosphogluconate aldolase n=1 Tax=Streptomyces sp. NBC_01361 TaxID=2903838 RepID=UPI003FCDC07D
MRFPRCGPHFPTRSRWGRAPSSPSTTSTRCSTRARTMWSHRTPHTDAELCRAAVARGVVIIPGGLTPTELRTGWAAGASAVKLFPASAVRPQYVKDLHGPFPQMQVIPSGGVDPATAGDWIRAGCPAVSMGGPLLGDALRGGNLAALRDRTKQAAEIVAAAAQEAGRG